MKFLVTGGAGFIGSHVVDRLLKDGDEVIVYDNLSSGFFQNIERHLNSSRFSFVESDLLDLPGLTDVMSGIDRVWHIAADPDVRSGKTKTLKESLISTYNLLEVMRVNEVRSIVFTSSSAVYGDAIEIPTTEDTPPRPISLYGASKLAAEAIISSYCHTFEMEAVIYRLANVIGERSSHGVIYDLIKKLRENPSELEILGDGNQCKSYLLVKDCVEGMFSGMKKREKVSIYNIGSEDMITVKDIAGIIIDEMRLKPKLNFTGGVDGGRGWKGDVKTMRLSIDRLKKLGWRPRYNSSEAVSRTVRYLLTE
jgi:UDP-glucose 4-epimerase